MSRDFFWGFTEASDHHLYLKSWTSVATPRAAGGLGLRKFHEINLAFVVKLGWQVVSGKQNLWVPLIRARYL